MSSAFAAFANGLNERFEFSMRQKRAIETSALNVSSEHGFYKSGLQVATESFLKQVLIIGAQVLRTAVMDSPAASLRLIRGLSGRRKNRSVEAGHRRSRAPDSGVREFLGRR